MAIFVYLFSPISGLAAGLVYELGQRGDFAFDGPALLILGDGEAPEDADAMIESNALQLGAIYSLHRSGREGVIEGPTLKGWDQLRKYCIVYACDPVWRYS